MCLTERRQRICRYARRTGKSGTHGGHRKAVHMENTGKRHTWRIRKSGTHGEYGKVAHMVDTETLHVGKNRKNNMKMQKKEISGCLRLADWCMISFE